MRVTHKGFALISYILYCFAAALAAPIYLDASLAADLAQLGSSWDTVVIGGGTGELEFDLGRGAES